MGLSVCVVMVRRSRSSWSSSRRLMPPARRVRRALRPASRRRVGSAGAGRPGLLPASPMASLSMSSAPSGWIIVNWSSLWTGVHYCTLTFSSFHFFYYPSYFYLRPFTWIMGVLYRMGASCRDRFTRRQSAASGQPDPERVSVFLYILFTLCAVGSERSLLHRHSFFLYTMPYLSSYPQLALCSVIECSISWVGISSWVPQSNQVPESDILHYLGDPVES